MNKLLLILLLIIITLSYGQTCDIDVSNETYNIVKVDGIEIPLNINDIYEVPCGETLELQNKIWFFFMWIYLPVETYISECTRCHLPVEFLGMYYDCSRRTLTWETMSETNNEKFIIILGKDYLYGQLIPHTEITIPGNGNSNHHITYIEALTSNHDYIELWQFDYNGNKELLGTEYSECTDEDTLIVGNIYPNPATEDQAITLPDSKTIQIYDMIGKEVYANIIDNKIIGLSSGVYIVVINNKYRIKLIIQ